MQTILNKDSNGYSAKTEVMADNFCLIFVTRRIGHSLATSVSTATVQGDLLISTRNGVNRVLATLNAERVGHRLIQSVHESVVGEHLQGCLDELKTVRPQ